MFADRLRGYARNCTRQTNGHFSCDDELYSIVLVRRRPAHALTFSVRVTSIVMTAIIFGRVAGTLSQLGDRAQLQTTGASPCPALPSPPSPAPRAPPRRPIVRW